MSGEVLTFRRDPAGGGFTCVEELDPTDGGSSDPLAPTVSVAELSEEFGEAFTVGILPTVSAFRFDHWIDGRRARLIEQRSASTPLRMVGEPEAWEPGCISGGRARASDAFDAVLDHFEGIEPAPEELCRDDVLESHGWGELRNVLPALIEELRTTTRALKTVESEAHVGAIRKRLIGLRFLTPRIAEDAGGLEELATEVETLHHAAIEALERVGALDEATVARESLIAHWVELGRRLDEAVSMTRALLDSDATDDYLRPTLYLHLAGALRRMGQPGASVDAARRAIEATQAYGAYDDELSTVMSDAAEVAHDCGDVDQEIEWLEAAQAKDADLGAYQERIDAARASRSRG